MNNSKEGEVVKRSKVAKRIEFLGYVVVMDRKNSRNWEKRRESTRRFFVRSKSYYRSIYRVKILYRIKLNSKYQSLPETIPHSCLRFFKCSLFDKAEILFEAKIEIRLIFLK